MRILLIKPAPAPQFGLAPFFVTEPLGLEYVGAALEAERRDVRLADLRFDRAGIVRLLRDWPPDIAAISCVHILDVPAAATVAAAIKRAHPATVVVAGGHAVSAYPAALLGADVDAIALGEGEARLPAVVQAVERGDALASVAGLFVRGDNGAFTPTAPAPEPLDLGSVRLPARHLAARYQRHYCCLNYMPVWTVETARGCDHRCKFCSVWEFHGRQVRFHPIDAVRADFEAAGPNVFVVDDTFWTGPERSAELAQALGSLAPRDWMLVQSRADTVVEQAPLLERWRPLAHRFDIFFGFEAPTAAGLRSLQKDTDIAATVEAVKVAKRLGFGVTGNFIIDPESDEEDFRALWAFLETNRIDRVGFTILTPLPGTRFFESVQHTVEVRDWDHYDLHHLVSQPRLPVARFFELYCETWRRSVLNLRGRKKWWQWAAEVRPQQLFRIARILRQTQALMDPAHYLSRAKIGTRRELAHEPQSHVRRVV
jgi:hopanoid C-3 methylase